MIGDGAIRLYVAAGRLAESGAGFVLNWRVRSGKEDPGRLQERFGVAGRERPVGELIWVHAASVGETNSIIPLIERLRMQGLQVLLTTGTVTSAAIAAQRLPDGAIHQYVPLDIRRYIERFIDHWQPGLAIFVESEIWPATLRCLDKRQIPLTLVNGRMSARSYRGWRRTGTFGRAVMSSIDLCIAQTGEDAARYSDLGVATVLVSGNMKLDAPAPDFDPAMLDDWRKRVGDRPVLVAASTHPGEEAILANAHRELRRTCPELMTIIVPRHPDRGDDLERLFRAQEFAFARRSTGRIGGPDCELYLADTVGEMGLWYRLATVAFLGGSLVNRGGQNPIEPAKLGIPILHGPHVGNFRDIFRVMSDSAAVIEVDDADELVGKVRSLITDTALRAQLGEKARKCVEDHAGALDRTMAALSSRYDQLKCETKTDGPAA